MRRKDREITDDNKIVEIIDKCKVMRMAMSVNDEPYIVPVNFGYSHDENNFEFYFHCAKEGRKLDMIKENSKVALEMDCNHELVTADVACGYGYKYASVIVAGRASLVSAPEEKVEILSRIMLHQTGKEFRFTEQQVAAVTVCKVKTEQLSAKSREK